MTDREFFEREWASGADKIVATASVSGTFYAVIEGDAATEPRLMADENGKVRYAMVVLMKRTPKAADGYNFGYKDMDEFCGPYDGEGCPERLLDMLSPIADGTESAKYAADWRARCRTRIAKRKNAVKLRDGLKVKLPTPLKFLNGRTIDTFTVRKVNARVGRRIAHNVLRFENDGLLYALTKRERENLTEVKGETA